MRTILYKEYKYRVSGTLLRSKIHDPKKGYVNADEYVMYYTDKSGSFNKRIFFYNSKELYKFMMSDTRLENVTMRFRAGFEFLGDSIQVDDTDSTIIFDLIECS